MALLSEREVQVREQTFGGGSLARLITAESCHNMNHLNFQKLCIQWVATMLTEEYKINQVHCAWQFLNFMRSIVTRDET